MNPLWMQRLAQLWFESRKTKTNPAYTEARQGVWTPVIKFGGANVGMTGSFTGSWQVIGTRVFLHARISLSALGSSTGTLTCEGLPFLNNGSYSGSGIVTRTAAMQSLTLNAPIVIQVDPATKIANFLRFDTTSMVPAFSHAYFTNTSFIEFTVQYDGQVGSGPDQINWI